MCASALTLRIHLYWGWAGLQGNWEITEIEKNPRTSRLPLTSSTEPIHVYCLTLQEGWFQHLTLRGASSLLMVGQWLNQTSCQLRRLCSNCQRWSTQQRKGWGYIHQEDIRFLCLICRAMTSLNVKLYALYILKTLPTSGRTNYKQQIQIQNQNRSEEPGAHIWQKEDQSKRSWPQEKRSPSYLEREVSVGQSPWLKGQEADSTRI